MNGPKKVTKIPLPTMCQPNAAGNCSSEQYSDTVNVKLLSAMPRKKPQMNSHIIKLLYSVCSAITGRNCKQLSLGSYAQYLDSLWTHLIE